MCTGDDDKRRERSIQKGVSLLDKFSRSFVYPVRSSCSSRRLSAVADQTCVHEIAAFDGGGADGGDSPGF